MDTHRRFRLDILIEAPFRHRLAAVLDDAGCSGYTIFSALGGRGVDETWTREGEISDIGGKLLFICVLDEDRREAVLERLQGELAEQIGYVVSMEVEVLRPKKFP